MPRRDSSRPRATTIWSGDAAWQEAELRDLNEAVDRLVLETKGGRGKESGARPKPQAVSIRRILLAVDGTDSGDQATGWAAGLAKVFGARVWAITVLGPVSAYAKYARDAGWKIPREEMMRMDSENGRRILDATLGQLRQAQVAATSILVRGFPAIEISKAADKHDVDLIIMGSHGHGGKERMLLGSVADAVKNSTRANVLLVKSDYRPGAILAAIDGSAPSRLAAYVALRLGKAWRQPATLLHVYEVPWLGYPEWGTEEFRGLIRRFELPSAPKGVRYELDFGHAAQKIVARAKAEAASLVVIGSRGRGALRSLVAGSISNRVSHEAGASVLLVKRST